MVTGTKIDKMIIDDVEIDGDNKTINLIEDETLKRFLDTFYDDTVGQNMEEYHENIQKVNDKILKNNFFMHLKFIGYYIEQGQVFKTKFGYKLYDFDKYNRFDFEKDHCYVLKCTFVPSYKPIIKLEDNNKEFYINVVDVIFNTTTKRDYELEKKSKVNFSEYTYKKQPVGMVLNDKPIVGGKSFNFDNTKEYKSDEKYKKEIEELFQEYKLDTSI